jgi:adenylosuccinate lyase
MCGLARFLMTLPASAAQTAAVQWLERTLDDSVNRRLTLPQAFLSADAVLVLALNLSNTLVVNEGVVRRNAERELPYMATEAILMKAVALGKDRQKAHKVIQDHSNAVTEALKAGAARNDLLERLARDDYLRGVDVEAVLREASFTGRAERQVEEFLAEEVAPVRQRYAHLLDQKADVNL